MNGPSEPSFRTNAERIASASHSSEANFQTHTGGGSVGRVNQGPSVELLTEIEQRVLWLAVRMVDEANKRDAGGIKVGGHQASSASMVSIMTALWFAHIGGEDKVAVKPHASPVYHAIKYLTGELDRSYLTRLRDFGGLQAYPSRTKDPDVADFSTGSVGLGAVAPLFSALSRRYIDNRFGPRPNARFIATVGDAELDEGNIWEAIADPNTHGLGNVTLIVDLNRQSLDRVIPEIQAERLRNFFANAGWHVIDAKYGHRLQAAFSQPGGDALRRHIDGMANEHYQSMFALDQRAVRERFLIGADTAVQNVVSELSDAELGPLVFNLGGHDYPLLIDSLQACDRQVDRPSVVFAYTIKGHTLPIAGDPMNHSLQLTRPQIDVLREQRGLTTETEWDRFHPASDAGRLCASLGNEINNLPSPPRPVLPIPITTIATRPTAKSASSHSKTKPLSSQEAFGRALTALANVDQVGERIVTTSPDVSISTNLGGWINKTGVFSHQQVDTHGGEKRLLRWAPGPDGQHIELGISEMNLFMMLSQLGLTHEHHGEMLIPVGTVYDPFVLRGLDALVYATYNGARFILAGTPAGVTLSPEGGAHQSTITPSVGAELPGLTYAEPCFAQEVDWLLCDGMSRLSDPDGSSLYLRMSTRPIDQAPFEALLDRSDPAALRLDVLRGGYRLVEPHTLSRTGEQQNGAGQPFVADGPSVTIAASGAIMPEAIAAVSELASEGVTATLVNITSSDRLFSDWRATQRDALAGANRVSTQCHVHDLFGSIPGIPIVSVHDASSHHLAWLGSAVGTYQIPLGVDEFGQSGSIAQLHGAVGIDAAHIVAAALIAVDRCP